ncbi:hypothetical protein [Armatimonas rosea]|uniref:Uncharacterized protein n=1 Tax=Armatimonas rosea TaxID=685828 RepID=A0A7W9W7I7_ARMRO|nr:hypothetical protein [Armatimonas rosea]MBB6051708.1 hypothetical protein [Armatimonas rosea]
MIRSCLWIIGVLVALGLLGAFLFAKAMELSVTYIVWQTKTSPDGKFKAVAHYADGGATSRFFTDVSIVPAGFDTPEKTERALDYPNTVFYSELPGDKITLVWTQPRTLLIRYPKGKPIPHFTPSVQVDGQTFQIEKKEAADETP